MFDFEKALNAVLHVLNTLGVSDFHKVFKVLYFAQREHLVTFGRPILDDSFISMDNGPVPSHTYNIIKGIKGTHTIPEEQLQTAVNSIQPTGRYNLLPKVSADLSYLSEEEVKLLTKYAEQFRYMTFGQLSDLSHDTAWHKAQPNCVMPIEDIAKAGGANEAMISYIRSNIENDNTLSGCLF